MLNLNRYTPRKITMYNETILLCIIYYNYLLFYNQTYYSVLYTIIQGINLR